jgi:drug/metabolite transporter (DMT)-like permease
MTVILSTPHSSESRRQKSLQGLLLAFAASLMWSLNSYSVAKAGKDLSPHIGNALRMGIALVMSVALGRVFSRHAKVFLPTQTLRPVFWIFVIEAYGGSFFYLYGLSHSSLVVAAILSSLAPVLSVPVAWMLKTEKPSLRRTLGIVGVIVGLGLLMTGIQ